MDRRERSFRRDRAWLVRALALGLVGCGECEGGTDGLLDGWDEGGDEELVRQRPVREGWQLEHDGPFAAYDEAGEPRISQLIVGTPNPFGDNFLNRGDVIVAFTGEPGRITIELRRFTFAFDDEAAEEQLDRLALWTYNESTSSPKRPAEMDPAADCRDPSTPWRDGCAIYVYYEGQAQLGRAGADIRVTLPPEYRQSLEILTFDNLIEDTYPDRGNVCIDNLHASARVQLESGLAVVRFASDATPAPGCAPDEVADCTDIGDPQTTAAREGLWSSKCACASGLRMGALSVTAPAPHAADIVVDAPAELWASIRAENEAGASTTDVCAVDLDTYDGMFVADAAQTDLARPWRVIGDANRPSDAALAGGGYALQMISAACAPVAAVESPSAWDPEGATEANTRGFVRLCTGCLGDSPCDALLPGN